MLQDLEKQELIQLVQTLEKENKELKDKLYGTSTKIEEKPKKEYITSREKVKLFMDIFKGRTDLYAKRWESNKIQRSGYSPVCKNEFHPYKCNKYKIRCNECEYRECLPLTEEVILKHLKGEITVGIYPLIPGDICYFLAIDFDKSTYQEDVQAFWSLCDEMSIPIYVERSRSGNGAHVWLFFQEATSAKVARKLGNILLTKTMEKASLDLDSYDRIFPNQDTMPNGGFGNLIALPFQGEAAKLHNTVFVNRQFEAEENQIEILKKIKKIRREEVYAVIDRYRDVDFEELKIEELGELEVPKREKRLEVAFQNNVECIIENQIYIRKSNLFPSELTHLKRLASFTNPKYYELQKLRMPIYNTPRIITCYEEDAKFLILPRGCIDKIKEICKQSHVKLCMQDRREEGKKQEFQFQGRLNKKQEKALKELLKQEIGVLCAATGFGKTVVGANLIAKLQTSTLVLVNRSSLLEQWKDRLSFFLGIEKKEIGQIGAGKDKPNHKIDVANFQTLYKKEKLEEILKEYGLVIVDECHHASSFSFEFVLSKIRAKHVYGLTAISTRKDGWHPIVYMQCGKIRYRVTNRQLKQNKEMKHIVITRKTGYFYTKEEDNNSISIAHILNDMVYDEKRNAIMIKDIKECVKEGRIPIILTERIEHIRILKEQLEELDVPILVYKGNMGKRKRIEIENKIQEVDQKQSSRIILATSSSIGEGFDDSRLDTLFLTMPVSWKGRIIQYVGRLHREHQGKETVMVYDYLDSMRVLEKMYDRRLNGYKIAGYEVEEIESLIE